MATLREFILSQSTLPTGNTVRDHILNPKPFGGIQVVNNRIKGKVTSTKALKGIVINSKNIKGVVKCN